MRNKRNIVISANSPCPCGSGVMLQWCCATPDGALEIPVPKFMPRSPRTNHKNPKCYLSFTNDCCSKITGEHFMSRAVLAEIGTEVAFGGAHWLPKGEKVNLSIDSLTSNILCARHNSALYELDSTAQKFFVAVKNIRKDVGHKYFSHKNIVTFVSGYAFEMWLLKVLCGHYFSGHAMYEGERLRDSYPFPDEFLSNVFVAKQWPVESGMYVNMRVGDTFSGSPAYFAPMIERDKKQLIGAFIGLGGLDFFLSLISTGGPNLEIEGKRYVWRPSELQFPLHKRFHIMNFGWPDPRPALEMHLNFRKVEKS